MAGGQEATIKKPSPEPSALPAASGSFVWTGREMSRSDAWIFRLSPADIAEIDAAVDRFRASGIDLFRISAADFPLPTLGPRLRALQREIIEGRGFVLIRGVPVQRYDRTMSAIAYMGIGRYFGDPVSQNAKGHLLGHIKDLGHSRRDPKYRGYQTTEELRYHTDSCDIVGLLCLARAKSGGLSSIASAGAIFNEIRRRRPDLLAVLVEPFYLTRNGEIPAGKQPWYKLPVFSFYGGYMTTLYGARDVRMAQLLDGVPPFTEAQREALDLVLTVAEEVSLKMDFDVGDIQLLHNHVILHARTEFEDYAEVDRKRHLLRLWLSAPNGRPLPPDFAERYGTVEVGTVRGGIVCPGTQLSIPMDAE